MRASLGLFTTTQAADLSGLTARQLRYWDRTRVFHPYLTGRSVPHPYSRVYDFRDLVALRTLAELRKYVPLQELRRVGDWLHEHYDQPWSRLRFYVHAGKVVFVDPESGLTVTSRPAGQSVLTFDLEPIADDVRRTLEQSRMNRHKRPAKVDRNRYVVRNEPVLSGTRIPTHFIWDLHKSGLDIDQILGEYPELSEADVKLALDYERTEHEAELA